MLVAIMLVAICQLPSMDQGQAEAHAVRDRTATELAHALFPVPPPP